MLMLGNLLRECLVVTKLAETASNTLLNMVTLVLTVAIGSTMAADTFLTTDTILIIALGLVAFAFGTGSGVVCAKLMNKISGGRINPLIGSAGIASVPIAARVSSCRAAGKQEYISSHARHGVRIWQACLVRRFPAVLCWLCFPEEIFAQMKWFSLRVAVCPPSFCKRNGAVTKHFCVLSQPRCDCRTD